MLEISRAAEAFNVVVKDKPAGADKPHISVDLVVKLSLQINVEHKLQCSV